MSAVVAMYAPVRPRRLYVVTSVLWTGAVGAQFGDWETAAYAAAFLSLLVLIAYAIGRGIRRVADRAREERTQRLHAEQARAHALQQERRRFAQELHDNIGRDLTILAMRADAMSLHPHAAAPEAVQVLGDTARSALDDLREMVILLKGQGVLPCRRRQNIP
ncbi:histidine kinase [Nesterenkonia pannonica]|uniref:histidine kinase n=1 Tax=Nesterenkonia pannonica TaxID=1548602 RepID=UPI0021644275|nr:histidine kinase [Nesterenkonia pannonica]